MKYLRKYQSDSSIKFLIAILIGYFLNLPFATPAGADANDVIINVTVTNNGPIANTEVLAYYKSSNGQEVVATGVTNESGTATLTIAPDTGKYAYIFTEAPTAENYSAFGKVPVGTPGSTQNLILDLPTLFPVNPDGAGNSFSPMKIKLYKADGVTEETNSASILVPMDIKGDGTILNQYLGVDWSKIGEFLKLRNGSFLVPVTKKLGLINPGSDSLTAAMNVIKDLNSSDLSVSSAARTKVFPVIVTTSIGSTENWGGYLLTKVGSLGNAQYYLFNIDGSQPTLVLPDGTGTFNLKTCVTQCNFIQDQGKYKQQKNLTFQIKSPSGSTLINSDIQYFALFNSNNVFLQDGTPDNAGNAYLNITSGGDYTIEIKPTAATGLATLRTTLSVVMNNGIPQISFPQKPTLLTGSTNPYSITLQVANFAFRIVSPIDTSTAVSNSWIGYCQINTPNCTGIGADNNGYGTANISDGIYNLNVQTQDPGFASVNYTLTVSSSGSNFLFKNSQDQVVSITKSGNFWLLPLAVRNVGGVIKGTSGETITALSGGNKGFQLNVQKCMDSPGCTQWNYMPGGTFANTQNWGISLTETGIYRVLVEPQGLETYTATISESITVNAGVATVASGNANAIEIRMQQPNVRLVLRNPIDNSNISNGWINIEKIVTNFPNNSVNWNDMRTWIGNMSINPSNPGNTSYSLGNGYYKLTVSADPGLAAAVGLASQTYRLTIDTASTCNVSSLTLDSNASPAITAVSDTGTATCKFIVLPSSANLTGKIVDSNGLGVATNQSQQVNIALQKQRDDGNWDWLNWTNTSSSGSFSLNISTAGTYRVRIEPQGGVTGAVTFSDTFQVTDISQKVNLGNIALSSPTIRVKVTDGGNPVSYTGVEIRRNGQWIDWANTGQNGIANINLATAGTYEFIANPPFSGSSSTKSKKSYTIVAALSGSQLNITSVKNTATLAEISASDGVYSLPLASATLSGFVKNPGETATVSSAQVIPINASTGEELWQQSVNSNASGQWSMNLAQGTYKIYARAPWGNSNFGNSDLIGTFTVGASGTVSTPYPSGVADPLAMTLKLSSPTWSGNVYGPLGSADQNNTIANVSVCLSVVVNSSFLFTCANTDSNGKYALTAPTGFDPTVANNFLGSHLSIRENMAPKYSSIEKNDLAVETLLGSGSQNLNLRLGGTNTTVTVTYGSSIPASNVWVNINGQTGWLGGSMTDSNGVARLNLTSEPDSATTQITVQVDPNPILSATYSTTTKTAGDAKTGGAVSSSNLAFAIALDTPNLRGIVSDPSASNSPAPYAWIQVQRDSNFQFIGGTNTNSNGYFSLNIPVPVSGTVSYTVTVNPPWNSSSGTSARSYTLIMGNSGIQSFKIKNTNTDVGLTGSNYSLSLSIPSVSGTVTSSSNPVANSWVNVLNASGQYLNSYGANTNRSGQFAMALPDGNYILQANPQWGSVTQLAKSANCSITVLAGVISTASGCTLNGDKSLTLSLRSPNLTMTVVAPNGTTTVPFANVGIQIGSWFTNAQSDINGVVSMYIDSTALTSSQRSSSINMWIDPPFGNTNYSRYSCNTSSSNCPANMPRTGAGFDSGTKNLGNVAFAAPNTTVTVQKPTAGTSAVGQGAFVNIFKITGDNNQIVTWIAGSPTNESGTATFNISNSDQTNNKFAIEVMPSQEQRSIYSPLRSGFTSPLTYAQIKDQTFQLGSPNVNVTILTPTSTANSYAFIGIEKLDSGTLNFNSFIGGFGTDDQGKASITLSSGRYRLNFNPGPGMSGATTSCVIDVNSTTAGDYTLVNPNCADGSKSSATLTVTLPSGNVTGTVKDASNNAVANAIVVATRNTTQVLSTTDAAGKFGMTLDFVGGSWSLKVLPPDTTLQVSSSITVSSAGAISTITLAAN